MSQIPILGYVLLICTFQYAKRCVSGYVLLICVFQSACCLYVCFRVRAAYMYILICQAVTWFFAPIFESCTLGYMDPL